MKVYTFVWIVCCLAALTSTAQTPLDNLYLGVGYNLIRGNPDGGEWAKLGQDPGLLLTRNILETNIDGSSYVKKTAYPQCTQLSSTSVFYDPNSYKKYLLHYVSPTDGTTTAVQSYAFSANPLYQDIKQKTLTQHDVFRDEITSCTAEHARYVLPVAPVERNLVTPEFAHAVCQLPLTFDQSSYKSFIDTWGTHVITEVDLGAKNVTRFRLSIADLSAYLLKSGKDGAAQLKTDALLGYGTVVQLNMSHLHHSDFPNLPQGSRLSQFSIGSPSRAPISWSLMPISDVLAEDYWQMQDSLIDSGSCTTMNLTMWRNNLETALREYPTLVGGEIPPTLDIKLPVTWPSGTYGLYMPTSGCPTDPTNFETGYVTQDTEDRSNSNGWTAGIHMQGPFNHDTITTRFCVKQTSTTNEYSREWPKGNYCIAKKGNCPSGFNGGYIHWDDEDGRNENSHGGILPDGDRSSNTEIWYCCRQDDHIQTKIMMPIDKPFYLLRYTSGCQQVLGMQVAEEVIFFDDEDGANSDKCGGAHPFLDSGCSHANVRMHFCYYSMKPNQTTIQIPGILG